MPVECVEMGGQCRMHRAQPSSGIERQWHHRDGNTQQYSALYDICHQHAPQSSRERIGKHYRNPYPDSLPDRNPQQNARYQPQGIETHHVVEDSESHSAPADELADSAAVPPLQILHRSRHVSLAPFRSKDPCSRENRKRTTPEHQDSNDAVLICDSPVSDEHERTDHRHVA